MNKLLGVSLLLASFSAHAITESKAGDQPEAAPATDPIPGVQIIDAKPPINIGTTSPILDIHKLYNERTYEAAGDKLPSTSLTLTIIWSASDPRVAEEIALIKKLNDKYGHLVHVYAYAGVEARYDDGRPLDLEERQRRFDAFMASDAAKDIDFQVAFYADTNQTLIDWILPSEQYALPAAFVTDENRRVLFVGEAELLLEGDLLTHIVDGSWESSGVMEKYKQERDAVIKRNREERHGAAMAPEVVMTPGVATKTPWNSRVLVFELGNALPDITDERPSYLPEGLEVDQEFIPGPDDIAHAISTAATREAKNAAIDAFLKHRYLDQVDELTFLPDRETVLKKWLDTDGAQPIVLATNDAGVIVFAGSFDELFTAKAEIFHSEDLLSRFEKLNAEAENLIKQVKWESLEIGGQAPEVKGQVKLHPEKLTVIEFFATWCRHCAQSVPVLNHLHSEMGDKVDVQVFGVGSREGDSFEEKAAAFARFMETYKSHLKFPATYATDETLYRWMYAAFKNEHELQVPLSLVVDPSGKILYMGEPTHLKSIVSSIVDGSWNEMSQRWARYDRSMSLGRWEEALAILDELKVADPEKANIYTLKQAQNLTFIIDGGVARAKPLLKDLSSAFLLDPANLARVLTLYISPRIKRENRDYKSAGEIAQILIETFQNNEERSKFKGRLHLILSPVVEYFTQLKDFAMARKYQEVILKNMRRFESADGSPEARAAEIRRGEQTLLDIAEQAGEINCEGRAIVKKAPVSNLPLAIPPELQLRSHRPTDVWEDISPRPRSFLQ